MSRARRTSRVMGACTVAAVVCLLATGCSGSDGASDFEKRDAREVGVVYEVTGAPVESVVYATGAGDEESGRAHRPELPWKHTAELAGIATTPTVNVVLGKDGGRAECLIRIRGEVVHRATAEGAFGTATCLAPLQQEAR
ncbi:hypothetical protein ACIO3O_04120 [Streptomyces sp. NPDC087440]|uniref:hypothetical protein n=1 Tax=Streptomyces sp. NPDC087440 TaxID=3365790 RepID=UPI0038296465